MDKASMLYNRFKNAFLVGEGEEVVSATFLRSLLEEKEREEAQRVERLRWRKERTGTDGGQAEEEEEEEKPGGKNIQTPQGTEHKFSLSS